MSFVIKCTKCGAKQDLNIFLKGGLIEPKILIEIATEDFEDPESNQLIIQCLTAKCNNTFEY